MSVVVLLVLALLAARRPPAGAQAPAKVKLGVLKLTSSARALPRAWRRDTSRSSASSPSWCTSRRPSRSRWRWPRATSTSGATGLTAGLYNIVAGGVRDVDRGRQGARVARLQPHRAASCARISTTAASARCATSRASKIGVTQIGSTFHYNVGRYLEKEGLAPGDVELVPLQALPALNDALAAKRVDAVATAEPFVSRLEAAGAGRDHRADRRHVSLADRHRDVLRRSSPSDRTRAVGFMKGYVKASRHYFDAVLAQKERAGASTRSWRSPPSTRGPAPSSSARGFPTRTATGG